MSEYRALLTDREREVLSGSADVTQNYIYQIRSRVRDKIHRLPTDVEILSEHHPGLATEFYEIVREAPSPR
jgi:hypothetical protein